VNADLCDDHLVSHLLADALGHTVRRGLPGHSRNHLTIPEGDADLRLRLGCRVTKKKKEISLSKRWDAKKETRTLKLLSSLLLDLIVQVDPVLNELGRGVHLKRRKRSKKNIEKKDQLERRKKGVQE